MSHKKILLMTLFAFGFGCIVIGHMLWLVGHHWGTWRMWLFAALGILNVTSSVAMVLSHLRGFDSVLRCEYSLGRLDMMLELDRRLRECKLEVSECPEEL